MNPIESQFIEGLAELTADAKSGVAAVKEQYGKRPAARVEFWEIVKDSYTGKYFVNRMVVHKGCLPGPVWVSSKTHEDWFDAVAELSEEVLKQQRNEA